jgi:hypothetical protein
MTDIPEDAPITELADYALEVIGNDPMTMLEVLTHQHPTLLDPERLTRLAQVAGAAAASMCHEHAADLYEIAAVLTSQAAMAGLGQRLAAANPPPESMR